MKKLLVVISFFCFLGFTEISNYKEGIIFNIDNANFDWLLGNWKRINEAEGLQTFEHWKQINDSEFRGLGYTLKGSDTIWQESIKLIKLEEQWNYIVKLPNAKTPTIFKVTKIESASFTCENPDNEFPKKIRYTKVEKGINAVTSGDGKVILFQFVSTP